MYSMEPLYKLPEMITADVASTAEQCEPKLNADIQATQSAETKKQFVDTTVKLLVSDQEQLLIDLEGFESELSKFYEKMSEISATEAPSSPSESLFPDAVINSHPMHPPYCLLAMLRLWNDILKIKVSTYVHSSSTKQEKLVERFTNQLKLHSREDCQLHVNFIWKNVDSECQLILSPVKCKPIYGEVNILRYFLRLLVPSSDIVTETICDDLLDTVHRLRYTADKERENLLMSLNNSLGDDGGWFTQSEKITLVDVALWSALIDIGINHIPANSSMEKWFKKCNLQIGTLEFLSSREQKSDT